MLLYLLFTIIAFLIWNHKDDSGESVLQLTSIILTKYLQQY